MTAAAQAARERQLDALAYVRAVRRADGQAMAMIVDQRCRACLTIALAHLVGALAANVAGDAEDEFLGELVNGIVLHMSGCNDEPNDQAPPAGPDPGPH